MAKEQLSQNSKIANFLRQSKTGLTADQAYKKFGVQRLSARIRELRSEEGLLIETTKVKRNGKQVTAYVLA